MVAIVLTTQSEGADVKLAAGRIFNGSEVLVAEERVPDLMRAMAEEIFNLAEPLRRKKDIGGVLVMTGLVQEYAGENFTPVDDRFQQMSPIGAPLPAVRLIRYQTLAMEKATRLREMHDFGLEDRSSWLSRFPEADRWGGAIVVRQWILSFSGCTELLNEALIICLAVVSGLNSQTEAETIAAISSNNLFLKLMALVTASVG